MNIRPKVLNITIEHYFLFVGIIISSILIVVSTVWIPRLLGSCSNALIEGIAFLKPALCLSGAYLIRSAFKLLRNHLTASLGVAVVSNLRRDLVSQFLYIHQSNEKIQFFSLMTSEIESLNRLISYRPFVFLENIATLFDLILELATQGYDHHVF